MTRSMVTLSWPRIFSSRLVTVVQGVLFVRSLVLIFFCVLELLGGRVEWVVYDALKMSECGLEGEATERRKEIGWREGLIWVIAASVNEIAAHFPYFTQLLVCVAVEGVEFASVDKCVVVVIHFVFFVGIWVEGCTVGQALEYGFDCEYGICEWMRI